MCNGTSCARRIKTRNGTRRSPPSTSSRLHIRRPRTAELAAFMDKTEKTVRSKRAMKDGLELIKTAQSADLAVNPDEVYAKVTALETQYPELLANKDYLTERDAAYRSEAKRVRYI